MRKKVNVFNQCCSLFAEGKLDASQTVTAQIADFSMWDREVSEQEINVKTCGDQGKVSSWLTLEEKGISVYSEKDFTDCRSKV